MSDDPTPSAPERGSGPEPLRRRIAEPVAARRPDRGRASGACHRRALPRRGTRGHRVRGRARAAPRGDAAHRAWQRARGHRLGQPPRPPSARRAPTPATSASRRADRRLAGRQRVADPDRPAPSRRRAVRERRSGARRCRRHRRLRVDRRRGHGGPPRWHRGHGLHGRATTPTEPGPPRSSATATTRAGAAIANGPGRRPATTTGRRTVWPAIAATSGRRRRARTGRRGTRTTSGRWHVIVLDSMCDKVGGCDADVAAGRWLAADLAASRRDVHAGDLPPPALQLRRARRPRDDGRRSGDRCTRPAPTSSSTATTTTTSASRPRIPDGRGPTRRGASASSSSGPAGRRCATSRGTAPNSELAPRRRPRGASKFTLHDGVVRLASSSSAGSDFRDRGTATCH